MPHAGHENGCHFALGYAGHGVALASYLGTRTGESLDSWDDRPFRSRTSVSGPPLGLDWSRPGLLSLVAAWYRFLDWIN